MQNPTGTETPVWEPGLNEHTFISGAQIRRPQQCFLKTMYMGGGLSSVMARRASETIRGDWGRCLLVLKGEKWNQCFFLS